MHHVRRGTGAPFLLIHGLGGSWRTWDTIVEALVAQREVIAVDLPGFGRTPPLPGPPTIAALADALAAFLTDHRLTGVDVVGTSMGARLALELARRGEVGATVALDPGGLWKPWERRVFSGSVGLSIRLIRLLRACCRSSRAARSAAPSCRAVLGEALAGACERGARGVAQLRGCAVLRCRPPRARAGAAAAGCSPRIGPRPDRDRLSLREGGMARMRAGV